METQRQEVEPADIIIPQELLPAQPNGHRVVPGVSVDRAATVATTPSLHTVPSDKPVSLRVSVVIPTLNEVGNIAAVLEQMRRFDDIIIVDGFSQDGTVEKARSVRPDVRVVERPPRGKGDALRAGFAAATSDIIVMILARSRSFRMANRTVIETPCVPSRARTAAMCRNFIQL